MILDPIKTKLQLEVRDLWIKSGAKGSVQWGTGTGKSYLGVLCIQEMLRRNPQRTTLIVVPTEQLKSQWEGHVKEHALSNCEVAIINTVIKNTYHVDLLLIDEIHRAAANTFKQVFDCVTYNFILGLTATLERKDGKHIILQEKCPIIHNISLEGAKLKGFVSDYRVYNLGIELKPHRKVIYDKMEDSYNKNFAIFGKDFELMKDCAFGKAIYNINAYSDTYITKNIKTKSNVRYDKNGKPFILVKWYKVYAESIGINEDMVKNAAHIVWSLISKRKGFLYFAEEKIPVGIEIIRKFNVPSITFSERVDFIDTLTKNLNKDSIVSLSYHSGMGKKQRLEALRLFSNGTIKFLNSGKAIEEGLNVPDIELAITFSGTSIQRQFIQRTGRALRVQEGKTARIINLYMKDTQDQAWCRQRTKGFDNLQWIDNLNEII